MTQSELNVNKFASQQLIKLSKILNLPLAHDAHEIVRILLQNASMNPAKTGWNSDITDDHIPFEFSTTVEFDGKKDLRILCEPQEAPYNLQSSFSAGLKVLDQLYHKKGLDREKFDKVSELFAPHVICDSKFSIWFAAKLNKDEKSSSDFKVYFNPQNFGNGLSSKVTQLALKRLGFSDAFEFIWNKMMTIPSRILPSQILYFSFDLGMGTDSRVKIYLSFDSVHGVKHALEHTTYQPSNVNNLWLDQLIGSAKSSARPFIISYAFQTGGISKPLATLHVPIRSYHFYDLGSMSVINSMSQKLYGNEPFCGIEDWITPTSKGAITYVSIRPGAISPRTTLYLSPIAGLNDRDKTFQAVQDKIDGCTTSISGHPFITRLEKKNVNLSHVSVIAHNLTFFIMSFQDMLRRTATSIKDPKLRAIVQKHYEEDSGHEKWFFDDLHFLGVTPHIEQLCSEQFIEQRDISYDLISLLTSEQDDIAKIAVLMSLEAAGSEFFPRITACVMEKWPRSQRLTFFGKTHQDAEASHAVHSDEEHQNLLQTVISDETRVKAEKAVETTFKLMTQLASLLEQKCEKWKQ